jgi:ADP-heptose:LPS heptosyltransferase
MSRHAVVLALPGLGDAIMATPALRQLRAAVTQLDAFCMQAITKDYLESTGLFDEVVYAPLLEAHPFRALRAILKLRAKAYDISVTIYPSYRWQYHVLSFLVGARRRVIDAGGSKLAPLLNAEAIQTREGHNSERNAQIVEAVIGRTSAVSTSSPRRGTEDGPIALHIGSMKYKGNEHKRWPISHFHELARRFLQDGRRVLIIAGPHEGAESEALAGQLGDGASVAHTANFGQLIAHIDCAALVVGNDTGVVHLSAQRGIPTVVLYGMTNPDLVRPLGINVTVVRPSTCPPCFHPRDRMFVCKRNIGFRCVTDLSVQDAYRAATQALSQPNTSNV